jgi:thiol-disulfide isomerase/thioredoxin
MKQHRLHPLTAVVVVVGLIWLIVTRQAQAPVILATTTNTLPAVQLMADDGSSVTTAQLAGQPAVLTLWASWCPPCQAEMPMLAEMAPELARRGIQFVAVNQGESTQTITEYMQTHQYTFAVWPDFKSSMATVLQSNDLPTTAFVDATGVVRLVYRGPVTAELLRIMADVLTQPISEVAQ